MSLIPNLYSLAVSEAHITIEIEALVNIIMEGGQGFDPSYPVHTQPNRFNAVFCQQLAQSLPIYLSVLDRPGMRYSEHLDAFLHGCHSSGIGLWWQNYRQGYTQLLPQQHELRCLLNAIVVYTGTEGFKRRVYDRQYATNQNHQGLLSEFDSCFEKHSKVFVLRMDFYYLKEYQHLITIELVFEHIRRLLDKMGRRQGVFENLLTYSRLVEQGPETGYHMHAAFYFNGHKHQHHFGLTQEIQQLWMKITNGMGYWYSSNQNLKRLERLNRCGIGMVKREDMDKRERALQASSYTTQIKQSPQHLRIYPTRARAFSKGRME